MTLRGSSLIVALLACGPAMCDVVRPGNGTPITDTSITIPASWGDRVGGNLFHSFDAFGVRNGQTVTFTSTNPGVANVITRVIGGTPSIIDGNLRSEIPKANFFLMNPNGIFFGSGAVLDVRGAFVATTADLIELGKGMGVFHANPNAGESILVSAPPSAFGFQSPTPAAIELAGASLEAGQQDSPLAGRTVALIGGDVMIANTNPFAALQGDTVVASVGGSGKVTFNAGDINSIPTTEGFAKLGAITLNNATIEAGDSFGTSIGGIDLIGRSLALKGGRISSTNLTGETAPAVRIRMSEGILLSENSAIASSTFAGFSGKSADIQLSAGAIHLAANGGSIRSTVSRSAPAGDIRLDVEGDLRIDAGAELLSDVRARATASGGDIHVAANRIRIDGGYGSDFTGIRSQTQAVDARGAGGSVNLSARNSIEVIRHGSIDVITAPGSVANGGDLFLASQSLTLGNQEPIPLPNDPLGNILTGINGRTGGAGDAGTLQIQTGDLKIMGGARIDAGVFNQSPGIPVSGNGGLVSISAENILIDGRFSLADPASIRRTGIVSFTGEGFHPATGHSGNIEVAATGSIRLLNGGLIDSSTFQTGNAGDVTVSARDILIDRGGTGIFTGIGSDTELAAGGGRAGDVVVHAGGSLDLTGGGLISAATFGSGAAGNVTVTAGRLQISGSGTEDTSVVVPNSGIVAVSGENSTGDGGSVTLRVGDSLSVVRDGLIAARVLGSGSAGTVDLEAGSILLSEGQISVLAKLGDAGTLQMRADGDLIGQGATISANAGNDGGNIRLEAGGLIWFQESQISADAGGSGGNIEFLGARHLVLDDTPVSASAVDRDGGNILISTGTFFANNSPLSVTSERGAPGTVRIETINTLSGSEEAREVGWLDPDDVLQPSCAERRPDAGSSFTRGGRGGAQRLPGGHLPAFRLIQ